MPSRLITDYNLCQIASSPTRSKSLLRQHEFASGRLTLTNAPTCDKIRADAILKRHAVDIAYFDFESAFDKALYRFVLETLADVSITDMPLRWFTSYLIDRTQQVRVGTCLYVTSSVILGIVRGSRVGHELFTVILDTLLRQGKLPSLAFADSLKSFADVVKFTRAKMQANIDLAVRWSENILCLFPSRSMEYFIAFETSR